MSTNFKDWYRSLNKQEKDAFADRAGLTRTYIEIHLIPRRKNPKLETIKSLAEASLGRVSVHDMAAYFLQDNAA